LRARIDAVFLPRPLFFVDTLPRNATGKLPRETLLRLAQACADNNSALGTDKNLSRKGAEGNTTEGIQ